jgi:hypothetical protein
MVPVYPVSNKVEFPFAQIESSETLAVPASEIKAASEKLMAEIITIIVIIV